MKIYVDKIPECKECPLTFYADYMDDKICISGFCYKSKNFDKNMACMFTLLSDKKEKTFFQKFKEFIFKNKKDIEKIVFLGDENINQIKMKLPDIYNIRNTPLYHLQNSSRIDFFSIQNLHENTSASIKKGDIFVFIDKKFSHIEKNHNNQNR